MREAGISGSEYLDKIINLPFFLPEVDKEAQRLFMTGLLCGNNDDSVRENLSVLESSVLNREGYARAKSKAPKESRDASKPRPVASTALKRALCSWDKWDVDDVESGGPGGEEEECWTEFDRLLPAVNDVTPTASSAGLAARVGKDGLADVCVFMNCMIMAGLKACSKPQEAKGTGEEAADTGGGVGFEATSGGGSSNGVSSNAGNDSALPSPHRPSSGNAAGGAVNEGNGSAPSPPAVNGDAEGGAPPPKRVVVGGVGVLRCQWDELETFKSLEHCLDNNPRRLKRIINIFNVLRRLLQARGEEEWHTNPVFRKKFIKWVILCEQWPYRTSVIVTLLDHRIFEGGSVKQRKQSAWLKPLVAMEDDMKDNFEVVEQLAHLHPKAGKLLQMDMDPERFWMLMHTVPHLTTSDLKRGSPLLRNSFNLSRSVRAQVATGFNEHFVFSAVQHPECLRKYAGVGLLSFPKASVVQDLLTFDHPVSSAGGGGGTRRGGEGGEEDGVEEKKHSEPPAKEEDGEEKEEQEEEEEDNAPLNGSFLVEHRDLIPPSIV